MIFWTSLSFVATLTPFMVSSAQRTVTTSYDHIHIFILFANNQTFLTHSPLTEQRGLSVSRTPVRLWAKLASLVRVCVLSNSSPIIVSKNCLKLGK